MNRAVKFKKAPKSIGISNGAIDPRKAITVSKYTTKKNFLKSAGSRVASSISKSTYKVISKIGK